MDTKTIIDALAAEHLNRAIQLNESNNHSNELLLVGRPESTFLHYAMRAARQVGLQSCFCLGAPFFYKNNRVVIDLEDFDDTPLIPSVCDIDNLCHDGMSCVAQAALEFLESYGSLDGKTITIVGRGHAVKGLAEKLDQANATVKVCHSHTKSLSVEVLGQDIVIMATPTAVALPIVNELVLDIGSCMPDDWVKKLPKSCDYVGRIGKLTNAILVERASR